MKAESVRICPACGTRNKPKWEYCVKCGESLQDVALGIPAGDTAAAEPEVVQEAGPFPWVALVTSIVLLGGAVYFYKNYQGVEAKPDPGVWTAPTVPPSTAAAATPADIASAIAGRISQRIPRVNAPATRRPPSSGSERPRSGTARWSNTSPRSCMRKDSTPTPRIST